MSRHGQHIKNCLDNGIRPDDRSSLGGCGTELAEPLVGLACRYCGRHYSTKKDSNDRWVSEIPQICECQK